MASNDPRGSSNLLEVATDVFAVVSRDVPANPSLRRRVPLTKARHLAADICAVVCGLRPACMIDYAPKMDAGVARAVLETLRADPRSGRHRETRALGVLLVEDVVLIADVDRVMRVFRDVGATGGAGKVPVHDIGDATGLTPIDADDRVVGSRCSVPQVALTGLCLGYPRVYTWTEDDVNGAVLRRVLSSIDLTLTKLRARLNVEGADGMEHLVSGWTVPTREDDEGEFILEDDGDRVGSFALAWMGEVEAAIDASGGAWSVVAWDTEAYLGPVAL
jgi:hypothetical protein